MAPRISKAPEIGTFNETPAACTQLACGADCVVTIGLCGRLRAWRTDGTGWQLVVDESSAFELANNRTSSHPYKFLTQISADGRFAAATTAASAIVELWCTRRWTKKKVDPADSEEDRAEWVAKGVNSIRAELSSLALDHNHLACGSREGHVRLWKGTKDNAPPIRRFGRLTADEGPVKEVVLTPTLVIGMYRASHGLVDGTYYNGNQSVVAWSLESGTVVWKNSPKIPSTQGLLPCKEPVVGAMCAAERLVVIHGPSTEREKSDPDWNVILGPDLPPEGGSEERAVKNGIIARSTDLSKGKEESTGWSKLTRGQTASGAGRVLSWHMYECEDQQYVFGGAVEGDRTVEALVALGFEGGGLCVLAQQHGMADSIESPFIVSADGGMQRGGGTADIGAVKVLPSRLVQLPHAMPDEHTPVQGKLLGGVLSADASGIVRLWRVHLNSLTAEQAAAQRMGLPTPPLISLTLLCVRTISLPNGMQPTCLGLCTAASNGLPLVVCGTTEGKLVALPELPLPYGLTKIDKEPIDVGDVGLDLNEEGEDGKPKLPTTYEWSFDSGTGQAGGRGYSHVPRHGTLSEYQCRRAFDGWAKTYAFEIGLQSILAKMNSTKGETDLPGGVKPGEGRKCHGTHLDEPEVQAAFRPKEPPPKASSKGKGKVPETLEQVLSRQYKDYHERMKRHGKMSKEEQEADDERREKAAEDQWKEYETIIEESNAPFGDNWFRRGLHFRKGVYVKLYGLEGRTDLNGCLAELLAGIDTETERAPVCIRAPKEHLAHGERVKVKYTNMKLAV